MKGRKHELNYPYDPEAFSDPACWLPLGVGRFLERSIGLTRRAERPTFKQEGLMAGLLCIVTEADGEQRLVLPPAPEDEVLRHLFNQKP